MAKTLHIVLSSLAVAACSLTAGALPTSAYASSSALKEGRWVKVDIATTGINQVSYETLRQMGFSDPQRVIVCGYGGAVLAPNVFSESLPDDLSPVPVYHDSERGRLLFYGEADRTTTPTSDTSVKYVRNDYSSTGSYFLTDSREGVALREVGYDPDVSRPTKDYHFDVQVYDIDVQNPMHGSTIWFDRTITASSPAEYTFSLDHQAGGSPSLRFAMGVASIVNSSTAPAPQITNGLLMTSSSLRNPQSSSAGSTRVFGYTGDLNGESLMVLQLPDEVPADFTARFKLPNNNPTWAAVDYVMCLRRRYNSMEGRNSLVINLPSAQLYDNIKITDVPSNMVVWNLSERNIPKLHAQWHAGQTVTISLDRAYNTTLPGLIVAFDPTADYPTASNPVAVDNQNIHGAPTPEMVIITTEELLPQANALADIHRSLRGMKVLVVTHQQVLNEFSSGTAHPMAYRRMAKMFYERDPRTFRHLLLYGPATWDPRHVLTPEGSYLLTNHCEVPSYSGDEATCIVSDLIFGMLGDKYTTIMAYATPMDINVGRVPAHDPVAASIYNEKVRKYLMSPPPTCSFDNVLSISDPGDNNYHFDMAQKIAAMVQNLRPSVTVVKAYELNYPRTGSKSTRVLNACLRALNQGCRFMVFSGHASDHSLGKYEMWKNHTVLENHYEVLPFAMLATCNTFNFDRRDSGDYSILEHMLFAEDGGVIAGMGSARTVYLDRNEALAISMAASMYSSDQNTTTGDVVRLGHRKIVVPDRPTDDLGYNTLCYNMIGDPSLPIYGPSHSAVITDVNGVEPSEATLGELRPLNYNTISGAVTDMEGNVDTSFNGVATITVYDGPHTVKTQPPSSAVTTVVDLDLDETVLCRVVVPVTDGHFTANVYCPAAGFPGVASRIGVGADSDDHAYRALGGTYYATIAEVDLDNSDFSDTTAPEITEAYIDTPEFVDGDVVGTTITLYAHIAHDESGINVNNFSVGQGTRLVLDGRTTYPVAVSAMAPNADGSYSFTMTLVDLSEGRHTLTLSVADNAGNRSTRSLAFVVDSKALEDELVADLEEGAPARGDVTFDLASGNTASGRLVVTASDGSTVFSTASASLPYTWNLKNSDGRLVDDGEYTIHAIMTSAAGNITIRPLKLMVVK